jgi:hypothetical protein
MQNKNPAYNPLEDIDQIIVDEDSIQARLIELGKKSTNPTRSAMSL